MFIFPIIQSLAPYSNIMCYLFVCQPRSRPTFDKCQLILFQPIMVFSMSSHTVHLLSLLSCQFFAAVILFNNLMKPLLSTFSIPAVELPSDRFILLRTDYL